MANFVVSFDVDNRSGTNSYKLKYKLYQDSIWTSVTISGSTSTYAGFVGLDNRIYDFQVQNLNNSDNPLSVILQDCNITSPSPTFAPTGNTVGYLFPNLSVDIDSYTVQLTTANDPGTVIATHNLSAGSYPGNVSDTFTGLQTSTAYRILISPVANTFTKQFVFTFSTEATGQCADPTSVTATLS